MIEKKEIEIHQVDKPRRRVKIDPNLRQLDIPVLIGREFGAIAFMPSGILNDDGIEIWTQDGKASLQ